MTRALALVSLLVLVAPLAAAHDFWLVPVGSEIEARTGSRFPVSTNAVAPDRLAEAVAVSSVGRRRLEVVGTRDSALVLKADLTLGGTIWIAVALHPRRIDLPARQFNEYLREDGLPQILALREGAGELDRPATERYQKFAKALVRRPGAGSTALEPVGHRIELVPLTDPATLRAGDTLTLVARFDNQPLADVTVHAGHAGQPDSTHAFSAVSDRLGHVHFPITRPGLWYARTIHMRRAQQQPFTWESFWASLTFTVP